MVMATSLAVLAIMRAARPRLNAPHERVAFAIHAAFLAAGFSLTAVGSKASSLGAVPGEDEDDVGLEGWDDMEGAFTFRYSGASRPDLVRSVIVRMITMGDMLMVDAAPLWDSDDMSSPQGPYHVEIKASNYATQEDTSNYHHQFSNLEGLVHAVTEALLSKLSRGFAPSANAGDGSATRGDSRLPSWAAVPGYDGPHPPPVFVLPGPAYGGSDLFPGLGAGVFPRRSGRGFDAGMLIGSGDPRWGQGTPDVTGFAGDPVSMPPQGARFDPFMPPPLGADPSPFPRQASGAPHPDMAPFYPLGLARREHCFYTPSFHRAHTHSLLRVYIRMLSGQDDTLGDGVLEWPSEV